jgi:hypothetical protein
MCPRRLGTRRTCSPIPRLFPARHGRTHLPGGSDPVPFVVDVTGEVRIRPIALQLPGICNPPPARAAPLDWSDATIGLLETNDPAGSSTLSSISDPFTTGEWYAIDWTASPGVAFTLLQAGVYVWQAVFFGSENTAPPAPIPYTVQIGSNLASSSNTIYHGDPFFEGPATGLLGNYNWDSDISGVLVLEPAQLDFGCTFNIASDFPNWEQLEVQVTIAKVADYRAHTLDLTTTLSGPAS